jgi:hypothetical protein
MSRKAATPEVINVNVSQLDLTEFRKFSRGLAVALRERVNLFSHHLSAAEEWRLLKRIWRELTSLNNQIKALRLQQLANRKVKLRGDPQLRAGVSDIVCYVARLTLVGLPVNRPVSDVDQLERAVDLIGENLIPAQQAILGLPGRRAESAFATSNPKVREGWKKRLSAAS